MADRTETRVASAVIFEGKINGKNVALLQSGIGKVAAAIGTTALLQLAARFCDQYWFCRWGSKRLESGGYCNF